MGVVGRNTVGAATDSANGDVKIVDLRTVGAGQGGWATSATVHCGTVGGSGNLRVILYVVSAGPVPGARMGYSDELVITGVQANSWRTVNFSTPVQVLEGSQVYVGCIFSNANVSISCTGAGGSKFNTDTYSDLPTDPFGAASTSGSHTDYSVYVTTDAVSAANSTVSAAPTSVPADNTTTSTVTVTLKDSGNRLVQGKTVTLAKGGGSSTITTVQGVTDVNGVATFTVKDAVVESTTYTATDSTDTITVTQTATVTFTTTGGGGGSPTFPNLVAKVAFGYNPFDAAPVFTDISTYVTPDLTMQVGQRGELQNIEGGVVRLNLRNQDRRFDPSYTAGPYYGNLNSMVRVQLIADFGGGTTYTFFDGFVWEWPQGWDARANTVEVTVVDIIAWAATTEITPGLVIPSDYTGAWIADILDDLGVPAGRRALDTGWSLQQQLVAGVEQKALEWLQLANDTEGGYLWQKGTGEVALLNRRSHQTKTSAGTFGNTASVGELPAIGATHQGPRGRIRNDVRIDLNGVVSRAFDTASDLKYRRASFSRTSNAQNPNEPIDQATYILSRYKDPPPIISSITIEPQLDSSLWAHCFQREIGDRLVVRIQPPGAGVAGTTVPTIQDSRIITRTLTWTVGRITVKWDLEPTDIANPSYWTLGDAAKGILGSTTKLGY